jgi:hypothetical protein
MSASEATFAWQIRLLSVETLDIISVKCSANKLSHAYAPAQALRGKRWLGNLNARDKWNSRLRSA